MRTVKVKICGITRVEDLRMACELGTDAVGFVVGVPSSPRNLSLERAKELFKLVPKHVASALVTVPKSLQEVLELCERLKPDAIQIHGELPRLSSLKNRFPAALIRGFTVKSEEAIGKAVEEAKHFEALLVDTYSPNKHGGTGQIHDWRISKRIRDAAYPKPVILAGGLTPENVKDAVSFVRPYAVDVSTGVELKPGLKDPKKVGAFIREAKAVALPDGYEGIKLYGG